MCSIALLSLSQEKKWCIQCCYQCLLKSPWLLCTTFFMRTLVLPIITQKHHNYLICQEFQNFDLSMYGLTLSSTNLVKWPLYPKVLICRILGNGPLPSTPIRHLLAVHLFKSRNVHSKTFCNPHSPPYLYSNIDSTITQSLL